MTNHWLQPVAKIRKGLSMVNDTKSSQKEQRKALSYGEIRDAEYKKLNEQQSELDEEKEALGYGSMNWQAYLQIPIDELDQAGASHVIPLQDKYRSYLADKQECDNTIYLEPSKLPEVVNAAEKLLFNQQQNDIYQRSGKLVRIIEVSNVPKHIIKRSGEAVVIKEIDQASLTVYLTKIGNFMVYDGRSGMLKKIDCPERVSRYLIAKGEWAVPVLAGIINAPTLRSDGSILKQEGYDPISGLLFVPGNCIFEAIPEQPTFEDAIKARDELRYVLKDFPFEDGASESVVVVAISTSLIRKSLPTAPLFGFTAPKMASGKSLLADVVGLIATGKINSVIPQAENEAEEKKRILAILIEGDPIICFDNIEKPFKSAALCSILTQYEYKDRVLGVSETRTVPTNATFLVTGNNLVFMGDISTRTLLCKLDPQVENPEERTFTHDDLRTYTLEHRSRLVRAALTILRAYHIAGRPPQNIKNFGRFEDWSAWVRSAIVWIGMADPCESRKDIEQSDPIRILLHSFFMCWYEIFEDRPIKVKQLIDAMGSSPDIHPDTAEIMREALQELAADAKGAINQRTLAKKLSQYKNRIEGGFRLENTGKNQGIFLWRIRKIHT